MLAEGADAEQLLGALISSIEEYAIYMIDPRGRVVTWNPGAERIKGWRAEEIIGRDFAVFFRDEDRAAGRPEAALRAAARDGVYKEQSWRVRKDGTAFLADVVLTPLRGPDGDVLGYVKVTRDVTERLRALADRQALDDLARRDRISAELADTVVRSLFGVGLELQSTMSIASAEVTRRIGRAVDDLDRVVRQLRAFAAEL